jgi:AraC family transcriptional regulator, transcriptional activator of pobA
MDQLFYIGRFEEEDARKVAASLNEPHVHDYEELLIGMEGDLEHFIDYGSGYLAAPFISFVTKGKLHRVKPGLKDGKCSFWVIRFKSEFIPEITFHLYYYYHYNANLQLQPGACFNELVMLSDLMYNETQQDNPNFAVIRHLLSALFIKIESERNRQEQGETASVKTQNITFKNFLKILEENYRRPEGVDFYAEKLFMTARNLNLICQNILQQSVSEIIETRKLIEAKNLLISTDKSVSEIGFELGYNEKSYFTTVFKRKSGQTPSEFREEMRKIIS